VSIAVYKWWLPGFALSLSCLEPLGLSVADGAKVLGVSRQALSNLVNGHARVSTGMAIRLAKASARTSSGLAAERREPPDCMI